MRKMLFLGMLIALLGTFSFARPSLARTDVAAPTATLVANLPSGQPVGTTILWTLTEAGSDLMDYRLSVQAPGGTMRVMYDFRSDNVFEWTPIEQGRYRILGSVRNQSTGVTSRVSQSFTISSRVTNGPVVTDTVHPLVALYSAPSCQVGQSMRVRFKERASVASASTDTKPCRRGSSMNFYIAGMREEALYAIQHEVLNSNGTVAETGPMRLYRTGTSAVDLPSSELLNPADAGTSLEENVLVMSPASVLAPVPPVATDLLGRVIWYYDMERDPDLDGPVTYYRPVTGGTFLLDTYLLSDVPGVLEGQVLREIDLAGHTVRETNIHRVREQVLAAGYTDFFGAIHHEARRLPNGHTAVIASVERFVDFGEGPVDVYGESIIVLDSDFQVVWVWNAFDHLDTERHAVLGETCASLAPGCPPLFLDTVADDWLHANAIDYDPADGNLLLSMRHQDWVIKVAYEDGQGDGQVVWRLGPEGDFTTPSADPYPFFSHQHDPHIISSTGRLAIYDNGNTRCDGADPAVCHSRGQVFVLDEVNMVATLETNADLGAYAFAVGSAQPLLNGNYHFDSGTLGAIPNFVSWHQEVTPDEVEVYSIEHGFGAYRSFRLRDLYTSVDTLIE